ncbi:DUF6285 domain-containing protein [Aromatoleum diolicum]|uniref:DUF6285 domain-containing protein n=1 Tax=Aromatoleum diolicum TaxID=75796 RepID=A0ABX1Q9A3_9RHOO|nr:DUF6285 domain-containing protein [Aromatoleum diolicum]NMG73705.1 hypothetical protein [Aromatoleum diolicum]
MRDEPTGEQLLDIARTMLREELLSALPTEKKHAALMIANAISIATRQLRNGEEGERREAEALSGLLGRSGQGEATGGADLRAQLRELNREFSRAIRAGRADSGAWREAAGQHLSRVTRTKVMESNPKYLGAQG